MGDFHELKLGFRRVWSPVESTSCGYYGVSSAIGANSGARTTMRPYVAGAYRSAGSGTGTGAGANAGTGVAGSPGMTMAMSMSPLRIHSSGYAMSTPPRVVHSSSLTSVENGASTGMMYESLENGPGVRFCHVGVVYEGAFYIFGGYDGTQRLVKFLCLLAIDTEEERSNTEILLVFYLLFCVLSDVI